MLLLLRLEEQLGGPDFVNQLGGPDFDNQLLPPLDEELRRSARPLCAATTAGVLPSVVAASTLHVALVRSPSGSAWPLRAAMSADVLPSVHAHQRCTEHH